MSKPTPRILKFIHGKKSFFVSFNYIQGVGIQGGDKLGTFNKDNHIYTSAFDNKTHQFHVNDDNDMCDDVYVLWCLLSEFIHTRNLSLEETGAEYNKIEMYIHNIGNIININLNLIILSARSGEEIKNVITDEIIDGKINSSNATFGDFKCNEIDLENIDSPNTAYGISHSKKMFMKKDDRGGGGGGDESGDDTEGNEYERSVYSSARVKKQTQAQAQAHVLAQAQAREQAQATAEAQAEAQAQAQAQVQAQVQAHADIEDDKRTINEFKENKNMKKLRQMEIGNLELKTNEGRGIWNDIIKHISEVKPPPRGQQTNTGTIQAQLNRIINKTSGGNPSHIHTGQRGGRFVMVGGRKRYLRK